MHAIQIPHSSRTVDSRVDLLTVDVEGMEYDALSSFDFANVHVNAILIEMDKQTEHNLTKLHALFSRHGFARDAGWGSDYGDRINQLWLHETFSKRAAASPRIEFTTQMQLKGQRGLKCIPSPSNPSDFNFMDPPNDRNSTACHAS